MRRPITSLVCLGLTWALALSVGVADQVKWQSDLETAFRAAREQNRPVLLHFWSPNCGHCMQVEQTVFTRSSVAETLGDFFVPVKINTQEQPGLATRYRIGSVPKDVILSPNGQELHRLITPASPQQYIAQLSALAFRSGMSPTANDQPTWSGAPSSPLPQGPPNSQLAGSRSELPPLSDRSQVDLGAGRDRPGVEPARSSEPTASVEWSQGQPQEVINRFARGSAGGDSQPTGRGEAYDNVAAATSPPRGPQRSWGRWPDQSAAGSAEAAPQAPTTRPPAVAAHPEPTSTADRQPAPRTLGQDRRPPMGLDGYCAVTLLKKDVWKQGDPRYGIVHRGRLYLFAGAEERDIFAGDPDDYSPVLAGIDPVHLTDSGEAVEGQRTHGVVYRKRVYLFSSEENLQRFWQEPERFAAPIRQAMESGTVSRLFR